MCLTNHNCGLVGVSIFCDNERQIRNRSVCSWSPLFFYFQNLCAFPARFDNSRPSPTPGQGRGDPRGRPGKGLLLTAYLERSDLLKICSLALNSTGSRPRPADAQPPIVRHNSPLVKRRQVCYCLFSFLQIFLLESFSLPVRLFKKAFYLFFGELSLFSLLLSLLHSFMEASFLLL